MLEIWGSQSLIRELHVPTKVHGSVFNDGWFSAGASWDPQEQRIAYVAEVRCYHLSTEVLNMLLAGRITLHLAGIACNILRNRNRFVRSRFGCM